MSMISFRCDNCGGEMAVKSDGGLLCPYCGSKIEFKDKDLTEYKNFRSKLLLYLKAVADSSEDSHAKAEELWSYAQQAVYKNLQGTDIKINYLYSRDYDGVTMYVARTSVIYVFGSKKAHLADRMMERLGLLRYPEADLKDLPKNFPQLSAGYDLEEGKMLAFGKPEGVYPLSMFGNLSARDAAWIVSRMENFCAVLEFSGMHSGGIGIDSVLINPGSHEAMLAGPWWEAGRGTDANDLLGVRKTAKLMLGDKIGDAPKAFAEFIGSRPRRDAYEDFAYWDEVIDKGFGGRSFAKFDIDNNLK